MNSSFEGKLIQAVDEMNTVIGTSVRCITYIRNLDLRW